jgi:hypothetical protein
MNQREGVVNMREVPEETWEEGRFGRREQDLGRAAEQESAEGGGRLSREQVAELAQRESV